MRIPKLNRSVLSASTILLSLSVTACVSKQQDKPQVATVFVKKVESRDLFDLLSYPARVHSRVNAAVLSEVDGIVTQIPVILGKKVRVRDTLMILSHTDPIYQYAPVRVASPIRGMVSSIDVTVGSHVASGQKLASVINPEDLEIQVQIPAQDLSVIQNGLQGEFKTPGQDQSLSVRVLGVSPFVDPTTGTASAQLRILSQIPVPLTPGIQGQVIFKAHQHEGFSIPESAIIYKGKDAFVRTVENEHIKQIQVELGPKQRGQVEILKGLKGGEYLVERASRFVGDGEAVKVE